jgi:hypothetical protein
MTDQVVRGRESPSFLPLRMAALAVLALGAAAGVVLEIYCSGTAGTLRYYTIQSNILVGAAALVELGILSARGKASPGFARLRMAIVIAIMVTGALFSLFLADRWHPEGVRGFSNFLLHYFTPTATFLVWLVFAEKGSLRFAQAPLWLVFPLLYVAYALIQGGLTGFYPYWFLDPHSAPPDGIGSWNGLAAFVGIVCAGFLAIGAALVLVDRVLAKVFR